MRVLVKCLIGVLVLGFSLLMEHLGQLALRALS